MHYPNDDNDLVSKVLTFDDFLAMMKIENMSKTAKEELKIWNIQAEYKAIMKYYNKNKKYQNKAQEARYKILRYMITCAIHDPENGDYFDIENEKLVKEAGKLLYEFDGMKGMHDLLFWSFIPKRYERVIDCLFNGIGEWLS